MLTQSKHKEQITWTSLLSTCVWGTPRYHTVTTCEVKWLSTYTALWKKSLPQLYTRYFSLFYIVIKMMSVYFSPHANQTRRHMQLPGHFEKGWNVFVVVLQITYPFNSCLTAILGLSESSFFSKSNLVSKHREKLMLQKYKNEVLHT